MTGDARAAAERAIDAAFVAAFRVAMLIGAGLALASALSSALLIPRRAPDAARARGDEGRAGAAPPAGLSTSERR